MITAERRRFMAVLELKGGNKPSRFRCDKKSCKSCLPKRHPSPSTTPLLRDIGQVDFELNNGTCSIRLRFV
jgi:hypothetical protein